MMCCVTRAGLAIGINLPRIGVYDFKMVLKYLMLLEICTVSKRFQSDIHSVASDQSGHLSKWRHLQCASLFRSQVHLHLAYQCTFGLN